MSDLIERCARALAKAMGPECLYDDFANYRSQVRRFARTVVREMREPTEAMERAGDERMYTDNSSVTPWRAMIDEALK